MSKPIYPVLCHLDSDDYQQQIEQARTDSRRHPPLLTFTGLGGNPFSEIHIPRIVADAYAFAHQEPSDQAQNAIEAALRDWPFERKVHLMDLAKLHWMPSADEETSRWNDNRDSAELFLSTFPDLSDLIHLHTEHTPQTTAALALNIMTQMRDHDPASPVWHHYWQHLQDALTELSNFP